MYLNALDNQVIPDSEMISLNYLPDNVPLDAKFLLESNSSRTSSSSQTQTQTPVVVTTYDLPKVVEPNEAKQTANALRGKTNTLRGKSTAQRGTRNVQRGKQLLVY